MYEQPSRQACDRCHSLKLRCLRDTADGSCGRCLKAGASCVFSPSNRGRRPNSNQNAQSHAKRPKSSRNNQAQLLNQPVSCEGPAADTPSIHMKLAPRVETTSGPEVMRPENAVNQNQEHARGDGGSSLYGFDCTSTSDFSAPMTAFTDLGLDFDLDMTASEESHHHLPQTSHSALLNADAPPGLFDPSHEAFTFGSLIDPQASLPGPGLLHQGSSAGNSSENFAANSMPGRPQSHQMGPTDPTPMTDRNGKPWMTEPRRTSARAQLMMRFMKDLMELNIDLIHHTLDDPVMFSSADIMTPSSSGSNTPGDQECAVDTTLALTQRLIRILRQVTQRTVKTSPSQNSGQHLSALQSPSNSLSSRFYHLISNASPAWSDNFLRQPDAESPIQRLPGSFIDQGTLLHVLSTYIRVIEAYNITFTQTAKKYGPSIADGFRIPLPSLQIGDFAMDDSATRLSLVIQSALRLLDQLRDLVHNISLPFIGESSGNGGEQNHDTPSDQPVSSTNMIKVIMATVREHEGRMMQKAAQLQQSSHKIGLSQFSG